MSAILHVHINGRSEELSASTTSPSLAEVLQILELKVDRVAVEHNGVIAPRTAWKSVAVKDGDRLEIVHFVGGGFI